MTKIKDLQVGDCFVLYDWHDVYVVIPQTSVEDDPYIKVLNLCTRKCDTFNKNDEVRFIALYNLFTFLNTTQEKITEYLEGE